MPYAAPGELDVRRFLTAQHTVTAYAATVTNIQKIERGLQMAHFLLQGAYTAAAWGALLNNPQDRTVAIRPVIEKLGGSIESVWFAFGEYDVVLIMKMPDNVSAAAFSLAVAAGGALKAHRTTPLMTMEEGVEAMRKAAGAGYRPPGN